MATCTIVKSISTPTPANNSFILEYRLMIIVPTHKCRKVPSNIQRPFMCTSGWVIITVQIHSRKKTFKGVKTTIAKWTINTRECSEGGSFSHIN
jgi:hypothetical protein